MSGLNDDLVHDAKDELFQDVLASASFAEIGSPEFFRKLEEAQKRREILYSKQENDRQNYGYSVQNPIMASSVKDSYDYLSRLRTADGLQPTWERLGSTVVSSLFGVEDVIVDCYQLFLDGDSYRKIYICPYGGLAVHAPKGMYLAPRGENNRGSSSESNDSREASAVADKPSDNTPEQKHTDVVNCSKCNRQIRKDAFYCRFCGERNPFSAGIQSEDGATAKNEQGKKKLSAPKILMACLGFIVLCGGLYWLITSSVENQAADTRPMMTQATNERAAKTPEEKKTQKAPGKTIDSNGEFSIITFGSYEQNNDPNNLEPIEWIVIKADPGKGYVQLMTKNVIDSVPYASNPNAVWSNSNVREWLNNDFLTTAFTASEQEQLIPANVRGINGDKDTTDKVFLLTYDSLNSILPEGNEYRSGKPTDFVQAKRQLTIIEKNKCSWGTRDPKVKIGSNGRAISSSANIYIGVRPSVYLKYNGQALTSPD